MEWVGKYGLSASDLIRHNVGWSKQREQLIYQFYGSDEELIFWQARNFKEGTTHKDRFFTAGSANDVIAYYQAKKRGGKAAIVEDCISGIVCSNAGVDGIPCFGSAMSTKKLAGIRRMYDEVLVWLDQDKLKESQKIARQLGLMGVRTRVIHTKLDPKEYALDEVEKLLHL